jgi:hypothetical protein
VTTFEQLFVAVSRKLSVRLCDLQNFVVHTAELVANNSSSRRELEDDSPTTNFFGPLTIFAVQYNCASEDTPLFETDARKRLETVASSVPHKHSPTVVVSPGVQKSPSRLRAHL